MNWEAVGSAEATRSTWFPIGRDGRRVAGEGHMNGFDLSQRLEEVFGLNKRRCPNPGRGIADALVFKARRKSCKSFAGLLTLQASTSGKDAAMATGRRSSVA